MSDTQAVVEVLKQTDAVSEQPPDRFTTKEGIVFKLRRVPPMLIVDAEKKHRPPRVPKVWIEDKQTHEENTNDPQYQQELDEYRRTIGDISNAVLLTRGTRVEHIPDGIDKPEDTDWAEDVQELTDIEVPDSGRARYFCWVKYVAVTNMDDFKALIQKISSLAGMTTEIEVAEAADNFRDHTEGNTAPGIHLIEGDGRGDSGDAGAAWAGS